MVVRQVAVVEVAQRRRLRHQAGGDGVVDQDRRVGLALHPNQVRLLVGDEVREHRHEGERQDTVEADHRTPVVTVLPPDEAGVALGAHGLAHAALRSNEMRGSTTARSRSATRSPTRVRNELIAKSPRTTG